ncbi:MAG: type IV pilin, partial [Candidatus Methylarchaceae archaeon HK02M1]|nr:type IV pilin [Candidatus Methylarchaceae archaeon HK02M1]
MYTLKRKKKAVSPVVAAIILIAVTIAIAIAVAGWVFGLFGAFGGGATVRVIGVEYDGTPGFETLMLT